MPQNQADIYNRGLDNKHVSRQKIAKRKKRRKMRIYNGTPHAINVITGAMFAPEIRKYIGGDVVATLLSDGTLNALIDTVELPSFGDILVFGKEIKGYDPLPDGYDIYIVSVLYATAHKAANPKDERIYTVADPVMSDDGKTFRGCRGIAKF